PGRNDGADPSESDSEAERSESESDSQSDSQSESDRRATGSTRLELRRDKIKNKPRNASVLRPMREGTSSGESEDRGLHESLPRGSSRGHSACRTLYEDPRPDRARRAKRGRG